MNLLDQYEKAGLEKSLKKGRVEGAEKIALNLLEKRMSVKFIEEATGLDDKRGQDFKRFCARTFSLEGGLLLQTLSRIPTKSQV